MEKLVDRLLSSTSRDWSPTIDRTLRARHIFERRIESDLSCDGYLEPLGAAYDAGFRLVLKGGTSHSRQRFTIAHELCHTFFYEFVPELKFRPHVTDPMEERLCNLGAAALLIPDSKCLRDIARANVSLETLEQLSRQYEVSAEAMFIRLRHTCLWTCSLGTWHRMTSGEFVIDRLHGGAAEQWQWLDREVPAKAWEANGDSISGRTAVECRRPDRSSVIAPVFFEIKRRGDRLFSLWARARRQLYRKPDSSQPSLLKKTAKRRQTTIHHPSRVGHALAGPRV
jgi:hypothetical protein